MDKILCMGNALVDVLAMLENDDILREMGLPKGCMALIDESKLYEIRAFLSTKETHIVPGGSAGNVARAICSLGGAAGYLGKVGSDPHGDFYRRSLTERGCDDHILISDTRPSGTAHTFISADGERTFGDYLGAANELYADELRPDMFKGYTYLFIEGYLIQNHELIQKAMELAKAEGLYVCIDLSSSNVVRSEHAFFTSLINNYVDIVFANEDEAPAYTGLPPKESAEAIARQCKVAVVKTGPKGAWVSSSGETIAVPAMPARRIDTTGAGDYFAAGFLYGMANQCGLQQCATIGSIAAAEAIQVIGTELPQERWAEICKRVEMCMNQKEEKGNDL